MVQTVRVLLAVLAMQAALSAAEGTGRVESPAAPATLNVLDVLKNDTRFTSFVRALESTGVAATLRGAGPYTVFAPTDDAFKRMQDFDALMKNPDELAVIVKHHIVPFGRTQSKDLPQLKLAGTLIGQDVHFTGDPQLMVNDAVIVGADLNADNGVVHAIDHVLMPKIDTKMLETARAERQAAAPVPADPAQIASTPIPPAAPPEIPVAVAKDTAPAKESVVSDVHAQSATSEGTPVAVTTAAYYKDGAEARVEDADSGDPITASADTMYRNFKHASHKFKKFFTGD